MGLNNTFTVSRMLDFQILLSTLLTGDTRQKQAAQFPPIFFHVWKGVVLGYIEELSWGALDWRRGRNSYYALLVSSVNFLKTPTEISGRMSLKKLPVGLSGSTVTYLLTLDIKV